MSDIIKIKKGLDIPLPGAAVDELVDVRDVQCCAVCPTDYVGFTPRLLVQEGDSVKAGDPLLCDKKDERQRLLSPVSGTVKAIVRGERRQILAVVVERGLKGSLRLKVEGFASLEGSNPQTHKPTNPQILNSQFSISNPSLHSSAAFWHDGFTRCEAQGVVCLLLRQRAAGGALRHHAAG